MLKVVQSLPLLFGLDSNNDPPLVTGNSKLLLTNVQLTPEYIINLLCSLDNQMDVAPGLLEEKFLRITSKIWTGAVQFLAGYYYINHGYLITPI